MDFQRFLYDTLRERLLTDDRIVMILGSRQVGKTTLCQKLLSESGLRTKQFSGDEVRDADLWASGDLPRLASALAGYDLVLLDEAQRIPEVGLSLKLVHDAKLGPKYLVTGSSSLELAGQTREPLTGRTWTYQLFPIAVLELAQGTNAYELEPLVREALVLGSHPALYSLSNRDDKIAHLRELTDAYLYKDVLELTGIRNPRKLRDLLRLLAFQVGSEVSFQELGRSLGMAADSVISYIDLLEKAFVVYRLGAYSRNLRSEVTRNEKVYFYDNGVRNALIEDFKEIEQRNDQGALWENLLQAERRKTLAYSGQYGHSYFWRLHSGSELDLVEERDGRLEGYEFKWNPDKLPKAPRAWGEAYPNSSFAVINPRTYLPFLGVGSHSTREGNS